MAIRPVSRDDFEIAIVCALPLEYNAVSLLFDKFWDEEGHQYGRAKGDPNHYTTGCMGDVNLVLVLLSNMGKVSAASAAASFRSSYPKINFLLLTGICGGVPFVDGEEILLADVIISKTVIQYDLGRQYSDKLQPRDTINDSLGRPGNNIRNVVAILETDRGRERLEERAASLLEEIQNRAPKSTSRRSQRRRKIPAYAYPGSSKDKLFEAGYRHKHRLSPQCECANCHEDLQAVCEASRSLSCDQLGCDKSFLVRRERLEEKELLERDGFIREAQAPCIFIGQFGSGDKVIKSGIDRDRLARQHNILAFEMEGAGIWDELPCVIVKGVCDYADSHKNKDWQNFAAAAAASVARGMVERYTRTDQLTATQTLNETIPIRPKEDVSYLRDLYITDPRLDRDHIQATKGGLIRESYIWLLEDLTFRTWQYTPIPRFLWIKGGPGKGKTMLLCGIIHELDAASSGDLQVLYFFCQETDPRRNSATCVLRGLIYTLVHKQPSLTPYIQQRYDEAGGALFEGTNSWFALSEILTEMLQDPHLRKTIVIIDALDECLHGLTQLLEWILKSSVSLASVKWLVSSRSEPNIQERLRSLSNSVISLEHNAASVSSAITAYVRNKVQKLAKLKGYDDDVRTFVEGHLLKNANGTFLWAAWVCANLEESRGFNARSTVSELPQGLEKVYQRMMKKVCASMDHVGKQILAIVLVACRPLTLLELSGLVDLSGIAKDKVQSSEAFEEILGLCGLFLSLQDKTIQLIHPSVKDFILKEASDKVFCSRIEDAHRRIFLASLSQMEITLRSDIYNLVKSNYSTQKVESVDQDPLAQARYSFVYWLEHFQSSFPKDLAAQPSCEDYKLLYSFLAKVYLYWVEARHDLYRIPKATTTLQDLENKIANINLTTLKRLIKGSHQFLQQSADIIEEAPSQTYRALLDYQNPCLVYQLFEYNTTRHERMLALEEKDSVIYDIASNGTLHIEDLTERKTNIINWVNPETKLTPLGVAAWKGHVEQVEILLQHGAHPDGIDPTGQYETRPPLWVASSRTVRNTDAIIELLLNYGADPSKPSQLDDNMTPLLAAMKVRRPVGLITVLVAAGASPDDCSNRGETARDWASSRKTYLALEIFNHFKK